MGLVTNPTPGAAHGTVSLTTPRRSALHLDLHASCSALLDEFSTQDEAAHTLQQTISALESGAAASEALDRVAELLLAPTYTLSVAAQFKPVLLDLVVRSLKQSTSNGTADAEMVAKMLHLFALLVSVFSEVYDLLSKFTHSSAFASFHLSLHSAQPEVRNQVLMDLCRIAAVAPNSLSGDIGHSFAKWAHRIVLSSKASDSTSTRLLALHFFALQQGISEKGRLDLQRECLALVSEGSPDAKETDALAPLAFEAEGVNVWTLEAEEFSRIERVRHQVTSRQVAFSPLNEGSNSLSDPSQAVTDRKHAALSSNDLSAEVCCIGGVLLACVPQPQVSDSSSLDDRFVETAGITPSLSELALRLSLSYPILLSGPPSSGKSTLIRSLSQLLKGAESASSASHLLTIQLGDQSGIDAKQLLGSFVSSPTEPGKFEWTEGALTRAVRQGKWVVLEDIDKAGSEVLSTVARLVEQLGPTKALGTRAIVDLGSRGKVTAGDGFALFATRSVASTSRLAHAPSSATFLGSSHWSEVFIDSPSQSDVSSILSNKFPRLTHQQVHFVDRLVATWYKLQRATQPSAASSQAAAKGAGATAGSVRTATLRDLIKWCRRVERLLAADHAMLSDPLSNPVQQEEIFIEACDIFLGSVPQAQDPLASASSGAQPSKSTSGKNVDRYGALVELLAEELGLTSERAWWALKQRIPELSVRSADTPADATAMGRPVQAGSSLIRVGRCELLRRSKATAKRATPVSRKFAMTKPSLLLLERLTVATALAEPVLLVGETGTGKTTVVQHLASLLGQPMVALNLSQQTESGDLLGAFKPLDPKVPATELHDQWSSLFARTFSSRRNARFVDAERKAFVAGKWSRLALLWRESAKMASQRKKGAAKTDGADEGITTAANDVRPGSDSRKKRKTERGATEGSPADLDDARAEAELDREWIELDAKARDFGLQHGSKKKNLVFSFVEGPLVKALRQGDWILLDEINLAAAETLDSLTGLLQSPTSSITLTERGDLEPIPRHPNFRLFACMNPATDVGKKDLPASLRSRFTELYVPSPDADRDALTAIVEKYIGEHALGDRGAIMDVAECYAEIRRLAQQHQLADGANQRPHYSIRTLSRALTFATDIAPQYGLRRSLWEGFVMAFTLLLDEGSARVVRAIIERHTLSKAKNARAIATFVPPAPKGADEGEVVQVGPFWLPTGPAPLDAAEDYILTPSVQSKLVGLSRAALTRRFPVLIQGPTSAGKTSAVEYLARRTGHRFVRINNHEHTDIQEYVGSYASDPDSGKLSFQEGLLVKALRRGDWIVLDELNLAPTDVLEALNRLLDDNRELVIPETGEVIKPHPHFMLFATQNPPGLYAGRKVLSRAFRNRFLELHFDDVPRAELETILTNRCKIAPSYSSRIVGVFEELQKRRQAGRVFETKQAFVTLRDLFRWGNREAVGYQQLAENGYMLIAERARRSDDKETVREVIEKIMRVKLDVDHMYSLEGPESEATLSRMGKALGGSIIGALANTSIVRTSAFQRLLCLVATSLRYNEPVLLVGETGAGKTSVCEVLATAFGRELHCVNCHQNTDTADLLGGQRPLRNRAAQQSSAKAACIATLDALQIVHDLGPESKLEDVASFTESVLSKEHEPARQEALQSLRDALRSVYQATALFEWQDGPLVQAMRAGDHILLDEISLADDSVLERLNSVLEPARTLVLAERATSSSHLSSEADISASQITGADGFQVLATMNPGGDYGKKELSPALRNRFTEIWVPHVDIRGDLIQIINAQWKDAALSVWTEPIIDFSDWFIHQIGGRDQSGLGLRDLLTWASFMNELSATASLGPALAFAHGASLTIIDGLGALPATAAMTASGLDQLRDRCLAKVAELIAPSEYNPKLASLFEVDVSAERLRIGPFSISRGSLGLPKQGPGSFSFGAKTSASNAMRVLRALSVPGKSVLLEGSPGAGKTSLITALANAAGRPLTRINLSDQTELVDLFGSDMPLEGGGPGEFAWRDAAFLTAMQQGEWVLLDEMNLASQTVLEGLNSCLDHRGTVYVPELGRSFSKHANFRIFAAQNPHHQGGGRKGLPKSFLNRFIKVHIEELTGDDILAISTHLYPNFSTEQLQKMIRFNFELHHEVVVKHSFGRIGAPWEFNLRDLMRWLDLLHTDLGLNKLGDPIEHLASLYMQRFRTASDRSAARQLFRNSFGTSAAGESRVFPSLTPSEVRVGHAVMRRQPSSEAHQHRLVLLQSQLPVLEALMDCVHKSWLAILVGPTGSGKTSMVRLLAQLAGARLEEFQMNSGTDTMDLIGTFEQYDPQARSRDVLSALRLEMQRCSDRVAAAGSAQFSAFLAARQALDAAIGSSESSAASYETLLHALEAVRAATSDLDAEPLRSAIEDAAAVAVEGMQATTETQRATGRFEWIDGPLLRALQEGHWLMLDNANLCSASVLDRLNSLFEVNGSLVISERGIVDGKVPVVRPHPNFRVFMCLDPRHGELSRAMRNRGIEIALLPQANMVSSDLERLAQLCAADANFSAASSRSTQKELMEASLRTQMAQRGFEHFEVHEMDAFAQAQQRKAASWAASQLVLTNSSLAAAAMPLYLAGVDRAASEAGASLLIRLSSPKALTLTWQLIARGLSSVSDSTSALLQEITSSGKLLPASRHTLQRTLVNSSRISQELADSLAIDLRYDDNVFRLLASDDLPSQAVHLLLVAMLHRLEAQQIVEAASAKRLQDLSILERSARLSSTAMVHNEDQATTAVRNVFPLIVAVHRMVLATVQGAAFPAATLRQVALLLRSAEYLKSLCTSSELDFSSIQILVRFMSDLMRELSAGGVKGDANLIQTIDLLGGSLQLTSGKALFPIWSLFGADDGMQTNLYRLICDEAALLPSAAGDLLKNALDVAATLCVAGKQSAAPSELKDMVQLGWQTLKMIRSASNKAAIRAQTQEQASGLSAPQKAEVSLLNMAELSVKTPECFLDGSQASRMRLVMQLLESHSSPSVQAAAASCKAALWVLDSGAEKSKALLSDSTWIRRLWPAEPGQASASDGPAVLLRPSSLQTLLESRYGNRSLVEKALHDASVGRMIKTVGASLPASSSPRAQKLTQILVGFVCLVSEHLHSAALKDLAEHDLPAWKPVRTLEDCCNILKRLQEAGDARLPDSTAAALADWIAILDNDVVPALSDAKKDQDTTLLGRAWISVSLIMLRLYLPNVALDPIVARRTMADFGDFCRAQLENAAELEVYAETTITGETSNLVIRDLRAQLEETKLQLRAQGGDRNQAWRKPNLKLLTQFYRETSSFLKEVVTAERVADLVQALVSGPSEQAEQREASLQASILSFGDRLRKTFAELRDMVEPIITSLLQLQLGLRLVRQAARIASAPLDVKQRSDIVEALVTFPTSHSSVLLRQTDLTSQLQARSEVSASLLIVSTASVAFDHASLGIEVLESPETLRNVSRSYERIFQLWALDRERAKREEEENTSLYKSRKIEESIELDAEAEEREFRSLFPEYDDDVLDGPRPAAAVNGQDSSRYKGMLLPPPRFVAVLNTHMAIFGPPSRKAASDLYQEERDILVTKLMRKHHEDWSETLDQIGAAFGLSAAIDDQLASSQTAKDFNFYLDPRPLEVRKATAVVEDLRTRLSALIQDWPEQMVLQHIRDRCDAVLRLDAASPVAKMLSALEQLLTHTEDWEGFASRETSIQANRERISAQIIEWRRLELSCWAELLNTQARTFQDELGEWWFRVYEILIRGTRAASSDGPEAFKEHVEQLIDAVDQFVRSSPLGQFEARLTLLESYGRFVERLVRLAPPKESRGLKEIGMVLQNVTTFFRQFDERISGTLQSQRAVLEKDIRGFIKLASWKDINIHALKQSAQKTHRQLHKTLRKFRDILRQPVDPMLASHLDALTRTEIPALSVDALSHRRTVEVNGAASGAWTQAVSFAGLNEAAPEHIRNLSKTLTVLQKMSGDRLWPTLLRATATAAGVADLADEIVDRQQQLAKLTPAFSKEDNEKAIKNLTARKRKAWSDLLKELRRVGLSSFVKTDMAAMNQSVMHIYTRPALFSACPASLSDEPFSTLERLFFRLLAALPKVRDSLQSHSPDLSTAELQRGVNYIEHITHLVLQERDRMHSELQTLSLLEELTERMRDLHSTALGTVTRASRAAPFRELADFLARLANALSEIKTQAPKFLSTSAFSTAGSDALLGRLASWSNELIKRASQVESIAKTAQSQDADGLFFLTSEERVGIEASRDLIEDIERDLHDHVQSLPALESLLHPVWKWTTDAPSLVERCLATLEAPLKARCQPEELVQQANTVVSAVLQIAQDVRQAGTVSSTIDQANSEDGVGDLSNKIIPTELHALQTQQAVLRSASVLSEVQKLFQMAQHLARDPHAEEMVQVQLAGVYPFLHEFSEMLRAHLLASAHFSRSLLKLDHTLCHLMTALATKGFCKPPEEQQNDDGEGDDGEQLEGGTGLGDGTGAKDITDQMQDDDEIEELQKDDPADEGDEGDKTEREKNAKEADNDFGGDLEDISEDGEDDAGSDQEGDDGDEEQPEDAVGDVDPLDPNAVDEKVWDGNDEDQDEKKDAPEDKTNKDLGADNADGKEAESVPKAEDSAAADDKQKQERPAEGSRDDQQEADQKQDQADPDQQEDGEDQDMAEPEDRDGDEDEGDGAAEEENEEADVQGEGGGRQLDQEAEQGENLDLDDDLNMDGGDDKSDASDDDDGLEDLSDIEGMPEDQREEKVDDKAMDDLVDDQADNAAEEQKAHEATADGEGAEEKPDDEVQVDKDEGEDAMDEDGDEDDPEPQSKQDRPAQDNPAGGQQDQTDPFDVDAVDQGADEGGQDESATQQQSSRSQRGRRVDARKDQSQAEQGMDMDDNADAAAQEQAEQPPSAGERGARAPKAERDEASGDADQEGEAEADPNPLRSMGDALEQFRRRMQEIQNAREEEEQVSGEKAEHDGGGLPEDTDLEHVANDDDAELQALGAAQEQDEVRKLGDLGIEDVDESLGSKPRGQDVNEQEVPEQQGPAPLPEQPQKEERNEANDGQQKAFMPSDLKPASSSLTAEEEALLDRDGDANMADEVKVKEETGDDEAMTPLPDDVREEADDEVQQQLEAFRNVSSSEERLAKAGDLWRSYASLTADLAFSLCEQLRLILAPTLATRLNGDFRTGKRLNMRKIVPFIASDFAKDKIWLRRTKPSSREYQVMLAIDDSRSMSESRSAHLAYQTLALVTGALSRLEVGDVSICRFGEDVDSLHDFGKGSFNDQNGAHVIDRLGFQQKKTNVLKLVEKSLDTLAEARAERSSSSASQGGDLWQLEIIISDGICQDHAKLRSLLRRAAEQRVMLVFVVIDSLQPPPTSGASTPAAVAGGGKAAPQQQPRSSILDMTNASYYTDASGRLQLKMERYMDTFPFDYYVVVREVEALPEVLSATLRQWVEKIRETES